MHHISSKLFIAYSAYGTYKDETFDAAHVHRWHAYGIIVKNQGGFFETH